MTYPRKVSRSGNDKFHGEAWNGFADLCATEPLHTLTQVQRIAHYVFWYMGEVNSGGHSQYFLGKDHFDHRETVASLQYIGATVSASVLLKAIELRDRYDALAPQEWTENASEQFDAEMEQLDNSFYAEGDARIIFCLRNYFLENEAHFVEWVA